MICLQQSWLNLNASDSVAWIDDFKLYRRDRVSGANKTGDDGNVQQIFPVWQAWDYLYVFFKSKWLIGNLVSSQALVQLLGTLSIARHKLQRNTGTLVVFCTTSWR